MSRYYWTAEMSNGRYYVLRSPRANACGLIISGKPPHDPGFYGQILARDMPDSGPYRSCRQAAAWVTRMVVRLGIVPADSVFGEVPIK